MDYDVFLSHNSKDKPAVEQIGHLLTREYGLRCWLDKWNLVPGEPWQEGLENALDQCQTVAVFVGPSAISPWENEEMRSALETRASNRDRRVIPVLLPGAPDSQDLKLPRFLSRLTWVDFRNGLNDRAALYRLYCGIQGISPGAAEESAGRTGRHSLGARLLTYLRRLRRQRRVWMPALGILILVLATLAWSGNLDLDLPLFCGRDFPSAPGYINLATQQRDQGNRNACAIRNLQKALTLNPTPVEKSNIYYTLASVYIVEAQPTKAIEASDLGLNASSAYQYLLHASKGIAYCQLKQDAGALQEFNMFLALNPEQRSALANSVNDILGDLESGKDMSGYCWATLGTAMP